MSHAAFHPFLHAAHLVEERLRLRLAQYDLQPRQARVIDAIARQEPVAQITLAKMFDVAPASMSVMLTRMEKSGLVERSIDTADARLFQVALTASGRAALAIIQREWIAVDQEITAAIGASAVTELETLSLHLRDALGGKAPHEKPIPEINFHDDVKP
jgi:DNA-binding MarR family transcriptional regulator